MITFCVHAYHIVPWKPTQNRPVFIKVSGFFLLYLDFVAIGL